MGWFQRQQIVHWTSELHRNIPAGAIFISPRTQSDLYYFLLLHPHPDRIDLSKLTRAEGIARDGFLQGGVVPATGSQHGGRGCRMALDL